MSDDAMPDSMPDTGMMGHNRPPLVETARAEAKEIVAEHRARLQEFVKALATFQEIATRGKAEDATGAVGLARDFLAIIEDKRMRVTGPLYSAQQAVIAIIEEFCEELRPEMKRVTGLIEQYQLDRKRKAEEQRAAHPQVEAFRDAAPPRVAPIKSAYGKRAHLRSTKVAKLTDPENISPIVLGSPRVVEAMEKVATELAKNMPEIPGFTISDKDGVSIQ